MITLGLCGIATYLLFAFLGLGAYVLVFFPRGIRPTTLFVFPPFFGCAGAVMALTHCLSWRLDIPTASVVLLAAMGAFSLAAVVVARRELVCVVRRSLRSLRWIVLVCAALLVGLLLLWSASRAGRLNSPYRQGIDQVGYITTAAVLMDGETLDTIETQLLADTMARNRTGAMQRIESAVDYTNQLAAVFLFGAVRWGFSLLLVFLTTVLRLPHVAIAVYPLLAVALSMLLGLVFLFCRRQFRSAGFVACLAIASSVSLNANMLNVAFDGQLGQAFCLPFFFTMWWQVATRSPGCVRGGLSPGGRLRRRGWIPWVLSVVAAIAILPTYGEFFMLLIILAGLALPADIVMRSFYRRSCDWRPYLHLIGSLAAAVPLLGGFGVRWLDNVMSIRFGDVHLAGWPQPRWASLLDILGYSDMYTSLAYEPPRPSYQDGEFQIVGNAVLVMLFLLGLGRNRTALRYCWAASALFVTLVYLKTRFIEHIHNYQYMKSYTTTGPLLFLLFAGGVLSAFGIARAQMASSGQAASSVRWWRVVAAAVLLLPSIIGLESLRRFHAQGHFFDIGDLLMQGAERARHVLSRHVIVTPGTTPYSIGHDSLAFHFPLHWLRDRHPQELAPYRNWPVAIYLDEDTNPGIRDVEASGLVVMLRSERFLVLKTELWVRDLLAADGRGIDWSRLEAAVVALIRKDPS